MARTGAAFADLLSSVGQKDPKAGLVGSLSFGSAFWDARSPGKRPRELRPFQALGSGTLSAPATGGDLLIHLTSHRLDLNFEAGRAVVLQLEDAVEVLDEVHGFTYLDGRDLTGFIDGTANPKPDERSEVALIGDEDPDFAGGSYVLVQRYVHDLEAWAALPEKDQERVIGRTKPDSEELTDKPETAHISRVEIEEQGKELQIVRHSYPYGKVAGDSGLLFIAYARDLGIFEKMLGRMFGVAGDSQHDRLMDYTRAVSGAFFFTPSLERLKRMA